MTFPSVAVWMRILCELSLECWTVATEIIKISES